MDQAAGSVIHAPYFDGTNYDVWKVKMRAFLWALDDRVWFTIENGWTEPTKTVKDEVIPKPRNEWTIDEVTHSTNN